MSNFLIYGSRNHFDISYMIKVEYVSKFHESIIAIQNINFLVKKKVFLNFNYARKPALIENIK